MSNNIRGHLRTKRRWPPELRRYVKVEVAVPNKPDGFRGRKATLKQRRPPYTLHQKISRAGRWSWALIFGWFVLLHSCASTVASRTVSVTLICTVVKTAVSGVHKLLRTGGVPTSLTLMFWRWLTVSSIFAGRSVRITPPPPPTHTPFTSLISRMVSVGIKHRVSDGHQSSGTVRKSR